MIARVEELEDLTHELKAQHNANELIDIKNVLHHKEIELNHQKERIVALTKQKTTI
jgi:hypothetical protein